MNLELVYTWVETLIKIVLFSLCSNHFVQWWTTHNLCVVNHFCLKVCILFYFLKLFMVYTYVLHADVCAPMLWYLSEGQETTFGSCLAPSTVCIPWTKLGSTELATNTYSLSPLRGPDCFSSFDSDVFVKFSCICFFSFFSLAHSLLV